MFFLGKSAWIVLQPLSLAFIMAAFGCLLMLFGRKVSAFFFVLLCAATLFVTLFTSTGAWALQMLEARYQRPNLPASIPCMIVLGGAFDLEVTAGRGGTEFNQSADRFVEAARLARLHPEAKILVSGGDGSFSGHYRGDAELAGDFFSAMGVDPARLIKDTASRNTEENVSETKALAERNGLKACLLITSAYHMPRAKALFDSAGLDVIPWPSDYRASGKVELGLDFTQPTLNSQLASTAAREWLALAFAHWRGDTAAWLP